MLSEPQKNHFKKATKGLLDTLNKEQIDRFYFLIDDILQYHEPLSVFIIYKEISIYKERKELLTCQIH